MASPMQATTACMGHPDSVLVGEVHAVGVLDAGDLVGVVLNLKLSLKDLDVHQLAFFGVAAVRAAHFEGHVAVMCLDKPLHQPGHKTDSLPWEGFQLSGQCLSSTVISEPRYCATWHEATKRCRCSRRGAGRRAHASWQVRSSARCHCAQPR